MGLHTNADFDLTPEKRAEAEKDERNDALIQGAIDKAAKNGPGIDVLSEKGQQYTTTFDRLAEQEAFASGDKPSLIPIAVDLNRRPFHWILSDADMDAVEAGYYCAYCLCRHKEVWQPACHVCGADRAIIS